MDHKIYSMVIGRFQCLPPHKGHTGIIDALLKEGKNVCIAIREADGGPKNPYSYEPRESAFKEIYAKEIANGSVRVISIPDLEDVCYGRDVGWGMRKIDLDKETEKISATAMRAQSEK